MENEIIILKSKEEKKADKKGMIQA